MNSCGALSAWTLAGGVAQNLVFSSLLRLGEEAEPLSPSAPAEDLDCCGGPLDYCGANNSQNQPVRGLSPGLLRESLIEFTINPSNSLTRKSPSGRGIYRSASFTSSGSDSIGTEAGVTWVPSIN